MDGNLSGIKELPKLERPREKAIRFGIDTLSNEELIAILLGSGTKSHSVLEIAHQLHSSSHGLFNLFKKSYEALLDNHGIGPSKALILSACFELCKRYQSSCYLENKKVDTDSIYLRYAMKLKTESREVLVLIVLNSKEQIIHEEVLYKGNEGSVDCSPNEIVKKVILHNGKYFYLIHNHPSGGCEPSPEDIALTGQVMSIAERVSIPLIDHIIIGRYGYYSFASFSITSEADLMQ